LSDVERKKPRGDSWGSEPMSRRSEYYEEDAPPPADEIPFQREGLPADYRMRHDEHYVDELVAAGSLPQRRMVAVGEIQGASATRGEGLEGLIASIQAHGVLQPLLVRRNRGRYELLSGSKRLAAALGAGLTEVPCLVYEVDDGEARRIAEAASRRASESPTEAPASLLGSSATSILEESLRTILSTLDLLERPSSSLSDHVALGLIRAETTKSRRLLHGLQVLGAVPALTRRLIDAGDILKSVLATSDGERRLLGIDLEASIAARCLIPADPKLLAVAFSGVIETVFSIVRTTRGARMFVRLADNKPARAATLVVAEDTVRMPPGSWTRWFDMEWESRPGGFGAAVSLLAARRAVELQEGRLDLAPTETGGCQITLTWKSEP